MFKGPMLQKEFNDKDFSQRIQKSMNKSEYDYDVGSDISDVGSEPDVIEKRNKKMLFGPVASANMARENSYALLSENSFEYGHFQDSELSNIE